MTKVLLALTEVSTARVHGAGARKLSALTGTGETQQR
jgi:hypothetical protein